VQPLDGDTSSGSHEPPSPQGEGNGIPIPQLFVKNLYLPDGPGQYARGDHGHVVAAGCAVALGCTLNDLVGMKSDRSYADPRQAAVNGHFETFNDSGKTELATIAERMSHDPSIRIEKNGDEHIHVQEALGA